ncbi:MAG: pyruvate kinase, partial [Candidatus Delongbacteria bacterium]|nr:pyruvate kinase [Candidatus Delongbacteria bacterium]
MKRTKIICTLGPATDSKKILKEMILKGMNVARINFSHGNYDQHQKTIDMVKEVREEMNLPIAILLDTKGPEIRIKDFINDKIELKKDDQFILTTRDIIGNEKEVSITYKGLPNDISVGSKVMIDDGLIEMKVIKLNSTDIITEVLNGGEVKNKKGVNVPGTKIKLPYLSEIDKKDILFGIKNDIDFIAASFVSDHADIKTIRNFVNDNHGEDIKIIAKIENRDGVDNIMDIVRIADGIMIARGDMGVEIPFEEIPGIQKSIIKKCYKLSKPVITATQMLDSMTLNPRPTRAEITDVANAVYDRTSAIMLSGETSIGNYPVETVRVMSMIAEKAEDDIDYKKKFRDNFIKQSDNVTNAIGYATCSTAHSVNASAIITVTKSGNTARTVSKYRPDCQIIATTVNQKVFYQLGLSWGVTPLLTELQETTDELFDHATKKSMEAKLIRSGDLVVITGGTPINVRGTTNTMKVQVVGDILLEGKGLNKLSASGNVCVITKDNTGIRNFTAGNILVISSTTENILHLIKNASALITEEEFDNSESVIVGKAIDIPVISNAESASEILKSGTLVTVNAKKGLVYSGVK